MPDSTRLYSCSIDMESAYGTGGGSPTDIPLTNDSIPELEYDEISFPDYSSSLGSSVSYVGRKRWTLPVKFYLKGPGAVDIGAGTPPEIGKLLRIFGLLETDQAGTVTWDVRDTSFESATIVVNVNGIAYTVAGARGEELRIPLEAGKPVVCEGTVKGLYAIPAASAYSDPTFADVLIVPPNVANIALTIADTGAVARTYIIPKCTLILNNSAEIIENVNAGNDGVQSYDITGRNYTMEATVLRDSNNQVDFWTALTGSSQVAVASTGWGATGNKWDFDFSNFQITSVKHSEYKGLAAYDIVGAIRKHATASSEFRLKCT